MDPHAINASVAAVGIPCLENTKAANLRISDGRIKSASLQASVDAHKAFVGVAASPIRVTVRDLFVNWVALTPRHSWVDSALVESIGRRGRHLTFQGLPARRAGSRSQVGLVTLPDAKANHRRDKSDEKQCPR